MIDYNSRRWKYISEYQECENIVNELETISRDRQFIFLASCAERMLLNYYLVEEQPGWGDKKFLIEGMSCIWQVTQKHQFKNEYVARLAENVMECVSDADEYQASLYYVVGEAPAICIMLLLKSINLSENFFDFALDFYSTLLSSLVDYIQLELDMDAEVEMVVDHECFQREILKQREEQDLLSSNSILNDEIIDRLRSSSQNSLFQLKMIAGLS
jgi:uncharacterized protein YjaG (DUF416 family)